MTQFTGILIPEDPHQAIHTVRIGHGTGDTLRDLQGLVGGNVDIVPWASQDGLNVWINDEGKFTKGVNARATALMRPGVDLFPGDYLAGDVVLSGECDAEGNTLSVPDGWEDVETLRSVIISRMRPQG